VVLWWAQLHAKFDVASFSRCTNIKGKLQDFGELPWPTFSYGCHFMMGLGKRKLCTKFEVARFSHCVNIEGEPPNCGELPEPRAMPTLSSACDFMMGIGKPKLHAKFEVASPAVAEIL